MLYSKRQNFIGVLVVISYLSNLDENGIVTKLNPYPQ